MADISEFYPHVMDYVSPLPPKVVINKAICLAARSFCRSTGIYEKKVTLTTVSGTSIYSLSLPDDTDIHLLESDGVREQGKNLFLSQVGTTSKVRETDVPSKPQFIFVLSGNRVQLSPTPDDIYRYDVSVMLKPTQNARTFDDNLFQEWGEAIAYGACKQLSLQVGKPWYNPENAGVMDALYRSGVNEAKNQKVGGQANEELYMYGSGFIL